jgi:hypothetical protein
MHDLAQNADPTAVDDTNLPKSPQHSLIQVFLDNNVDFLWLKRVKVNGILNRDVLHSESI